MKAQDSKQNQVYELKHVNVHKMEYSNETKKAITIGLDAVLNTLKKEGIRTALRQKAEDVLCNYLRWF